MNTILRHAAALIACVAACGSAFAAPVTVTEAKETIPTYLAGDPEPNPMFYFGRQSQGAEGRTYPYPLYDNLTNVKSEKTYDLIYLENQYVKIGILPEIGGRLFSAVDKTNNYDYIYRQHAIKPALIGLIGAWISGGIEWNIPHHHRASTFIPVQHKIEKNADGGATVWVGELEVRQRMRWAVGYTLRPDSNVLECKLRIVNRTPEPHSMLTFANVAVNANENYQIIFPPSTQLVTHHSKREFTTWPIANYPYGGVDWKGEDVSMYKNHTRSNSMFAWNYWDDFFAGYDHGKEAGVMSIADHHIVPGKKFWTWGVGSQWDQILTDDDGPYIELMVGAYSDNQPDYSWLQPFETRSFSMNWYPFRDIGGVKNANLEAAVNVEVSTGTAHVGFNTTAAHEAATVLIKAGDKVLKEETIAIAPDKPYKAEVALPAGTDQHDVRASLSIGGREVVAYSPLRLKPIEQLPPAYEAPGEPADFKTVEELYLAGLRIDQFHSPSLEPEPYWEEALKRDPNDARVNTAMAMLDLRRAKFESAEARLRKAIDRLAFNYTTPLDAAPYYYLGLALKFQNRPDEAYDMFYKAAWSGEWKAPAYYSLAEISAARGDWDKALEHVGQALDFNAQNSRAHALKAAILRHLKRNDEAKAALDVAAAKIEPLDPRLMAERWLLDKSAATGAPLSVALNQWPELAQELGAEYANAGLYQDGADVLAAAAAGASDQAKVSPLTRHWIAYFAEKLGNGDEAKAERRLAAAASPDYAFPFQQEAIAVLESAIKADPKDARAPYYLGNLLYDWQPARAVALWEASAKLDPKFPIVQRNLAVAATLNGDSDDPAARATAVAYLEKAIAADKTYALHFIELDQLYRQTGVAPEKRLAAMEAHQQVAVGRDDALASLINLKTLTGKADEAVKLLEGRTFSIWEGGSPYNAGELWTDAHLVRGRERLAAGDAAGALADFAAAGEYPANLRAREGGSSARRSEIAYWTGTAHDKLGAADKAKAEWTIAAEAPAAEGGRGGGRRGGGRRGGGRGGRGGGFGGASPAVQQYYQALALQKLDRAGEARPILNALVAAGEGQGANAKLSLALGRLGLGETAPAKAALDAVLNEAPDNLTARLERKPLG